MRACSTGTNALPVPRLPLRIGLVASPGTEGFADFTGQLEASGLAFAVEVVPTQVQGRGSARAVASAVRRLQPRRCDVIVVVRGGGSKTDLATFDSEPVARAIANSDTPVWTGIGHTGDQSVADEVANRSFITPTECGQELTRLAAEYWEGVIEAGEAVGRLAGEQLVRSEQSLDRHRHRMVTGARSLLDRHAERLVHRARTLRGSARGQVEAHVRLVGAQGGRAGPGVAPFPGYRPRRARPTDRSIGRPTRPATACGGPPGGPVAEAARGLRLPAPAPTGLLGHPGRLRPGGPLGRRSSPRGRVCTPAWPTARWSSDRQ